MSVYGGVVLSYKNIFLRYLLSMNQKVTTQQVIDAFIQLSRIREYPPTLEEVGRIVGISKSGVKRHIDKAKDNGDVTYKPRRSRTVVVIR